MEQMFFNDEQVVNIDYSDHKRKPIIEVFVINQAGEYEHYASSIYLSPSSKKVSISFGGNYASGYVLFK
jgi:hypothetical protein